MTSLMDLSMEVDNAFQSVLAAETEEAKDAAERHLMEMLEGRSEKLSAVAWVLSRFTRDANNLRAEAEMLIAAAERCDAEERRLRTYIQRVMELSGTQSMKSPLATFSLADGSESVEILTPEMVPNEYRKEVVPPLDKTAIKDALKAGKEVPGARLKKGETQLRVRYAKSSADVLNPDRNTLTPAAEAARED